MAIENNPVQPLAVPFLYFRTVFDILTVVLVFVFFFLKKCKGHPFLHTGTPMLPTYPPAGSSKNGFFIWKKNKKRAFFTWFFKKRAFFRKNRFDKIPFFCFWPLHSSFCPLDIRICPLKYSYLLVKWGGTYLPVRRTTENQKNSIGVPVCKNGCPLGKGG